MILVHFIVAVFQSFIVFDFKTNDADSFKTLDSSEINPETRQFLAQYFKPYDARA